MIEVIVSPLAQLDAIETQERLDNERSGFGLRFAREFATAIESIRHTPLMYARTEDRPDEVETREYSISRFQQRVIFSLNESVATILAVILARQRPGSWVRRIP